MTKAISCPVKTYAVHDLLTQTNHSCGIRIFIRSNISTYERYEFMENILGIKVVTEKNKHVYIFGMYI